MVFSTNDPSHIYCGSAARLSGAAGGYVSGETARFSRRNPAEGTILIQLKIPVARYRSTLAALSARLGTRI